MNRVQGFLRGVAVVVLTCWVCETVSAGNSQAGAGSLLDRVEHHFADSDGVKIHYVALGEGPLVVMIHGFPDYWYTWRGQMEALADRYRVVAMDTRGYNRSDKPEGVGKYAMPLLLGDVAAVIRDCGRERATIVGHDWGGAIAWAFAMYRADMVERLVILNLPHPNGMSRELASNSKQQENSDYARKFQEEGAHEALTAEGLAGWVKDAEARRHYIEAFGRSDFRAMMNYYRANYPRVGNPGSSDGKQPPAKAPPSRTPRVGVPVLMFHGLQDPYLLHDGLNRTWEWLDADLTLVTVPDASHFVQHDAPQLVSRTLRYWLDMRAFPDPDGTVGGDR